MIENFEIVKYKCFENFKLEGLSRINIITGDNNVGKTALLEATYLSCVELFQQDSFFSSLYGAEGVINIALNRDIRPQSKNLTNYFRNFYLKVRVNECKVLRFAYQSKYDFTEEHQKSIRSNDTENEFDECIVMDNAKESIVFSFKFLNGLKDANIMNYINSSKPIQKQLVELYSKIQTKGIQHKFLSYLQVFDKNIVWIEPQLIGDDVYLRVNLHNPDISLLSSELGEGVNRLIQILATILTTSAKVIFIDEIENGIYYKKFKDIWKTIIEIAQKEDVQLFVTTHNEDTIEALKEASEEMEFDDISSIELFKKDGVIHPIVRNYQSFNASVDAGLDIR